MLCFAFWFVRNRARRRLIRTVQKGGAVLLLSSVKEDHLSAGNFSLALQAGSDPWKYWQHITTFVEQAGCLNFYHSNVTSLWTFAWAWCTNFWTYKACAYKHSTASLQESRSILPVPILVVKWMFCSKKNNWKQIYKINHCPYVANVSDSQLLLLNCLPAKRPLWICSQARKSFGSCGDLFHRCQP